MARVIDRLEFAARARHVKAAEQLAIIYLSRGERESALGWAKYAMEIGGPEEARQYAVYLGSDDARLGEAVEAFEQAARKGSVGAMYELAQMYNSGLKIPQDYDRANYWWRQAANAGSVGAMVALGMNIQAEFGTKLNPAEAVDLYKRAYEKGSPSGAAYLLGLSYEKGRGVAKDSLMAIAWYERQSRTVEVCTARFRIGYLYETGSGVVKDIQRARQHYESATRADPFACWQPYERLAAIAPESQGAEAYRKKAASIRQSYATVRGLMPKTDYSRVRGLDDPP